jgi:hypothetical protein
MILATDAHRMIDVVDDVPRPRLAVGARNGMK